MDCKMVERVIYRYIYGESDATELRKIKDHLDRCGECRRESAIIADILEHMKQAIPDDPVSDGFKERILARIHAEAE